MSRTCRATLGRTPTDIVNAARLERAAARLRESDAAIADIARGAGFGHMGTFHKAFKARFGHTPCAFRVRHRAIAPSRLNGAGATG